MRTRFWTESGDGQTDWQAVALS